MSVSPAAVHQLESAAAIEAGTEYAASRRSADAEKQAKVSQRLLRSSYPLAYLTDEN